MYNLTQVAKMLDTTPSLINRAQKKLHLKYSGKGKASCFNHEDIELFRQIKALRLIGVSYEEIKELGNSVKNEKLQKKIIFVIFQAGGWLAKNRGNVSAVKWLINDLSYPKNMRKQKTERRKGCEKELSGMMKS